ncbi:MAG: ATP-dependent zinc metalloprotease FtsH [Clostridia bacterium]|nr:ATP-dependent zinc metalloprotease FtsH [Clostridia bacterium]
MTTTANGGAKKINYNEFVSYVENVQYYVKEGKVYSVKPDENGQPTDMTANGYAVNENGKITLNGEEIVVITKINVDGYQVNGYIYDAARDKEINSYYMVGPSFFDTPLEDSVIETWRKMGLEIEYENPNSGNYWSSLISVGGLVLVCVVFWLMIRSTAGGGGKVISFAKSKARVSTNIKVRFSDVAGAEEEKVELAEIVEFLKAPKKFSDLGARIPKGVLLVGPPGTGKTLFAKAVAGEAGVPFFSVSGSDFVEMYVGVGASRVRDLFEMAKKNQPCIIFIDEIDAVGRHRGAGLGGGNDEREQTLNQILVQMDGFEGNDGIIIMAATNRADILDPALMRPGRFDRQVYVNLPDIKGREQILKVHARNKPFAKDVNFRTIARLTSGFSGADLANLLNEAAIFAARENKQFIDNTDLYEAFTKVAMGPKKKSKVVTESEKRITAYHESGHAILAKLCKNCHPVQEVTIIPRGNAGGYTLSNPETDISYYTKSFLLDDICMALGGNVAEELVIKDVTSGASGDIRAATEMARKMVTEWGMSEKLGMVNYGSNSQTVFLGKDMGTRNTYSEETAKIIDEEMRTIVENARKRAVELLSANRSVLDNMARVLIERETIYTEEVDMLLEGKSYTEVLEYIDKRDAEHKGNSFKRFE